MIMKTQRVVSSGGVIFREAEGRFEVALICIGKRWSLPKGLIEQGETAEETALREVKEETGLEGEIVQKIGKISYSFTWKKHYLKTVHFYLLRFLGGSIRNHDYEVDRVKWLPLSEAIQALTYASEKKIVEKAGKILAGKAQP